MNERIWNQSLLLTAVAVAIMSAISVWLAWNTAGDFSAHLSLQGIAPILAAAFTSYALRLLRFYYLLSRSGVALSLRSTLVVQMVGFALSVTPGHIGEVFKLHLIRERVGTPVAQTAPLLLLDRLTEGGGFLFLAAVSAFMLPTPLKQIPAPVLLVVGLVLAFFFAFTRNWWYKYLTSVHPSLLQSRWVRGALPHLQNLWRGLDATFTPQQIVVALAFSAVARFADGFVVLYAAQMVGVNLALPTAVFVLAASGFAGGISFLPAGVGAVETVMVGLFIALGTALPNALAISLLARLATLWMWVALGLGLAFLLRWRALYSQSREGNRP